MTFYLKLVINDPKKELIVGPFSKILLKDGDIYGDNTMIAQHDCENSFKYRIKTNKNHFKLVESVEVLNAIPT